MFSCLFILRDRVKPCHRQVLGSRLFAVRWKSVSFTLVGWYVSKSKLISLIKYVISLQFPTYKTMKQRCASAIFVCGWKRLEVCQLKCKHFGVYSNRNLQFFYLSSVLCWPIFKKAFLYHLFPPYRWVFAQMSAGIFMSWAWTRYTVSAQFVECPRSVCYDKQRIRQNRCEGRRFLSFRKSYTPCDGRAP